VMTLKDAGFRVRLFAVYHPDVDIRIWKQVELKRITLKEKPTVLRFMQFLLKAIPWILRQRSDLFISYDYLPLLPCALKKRISGTPFIYDSIELVAGLNQLENKPFRRFLWMRYESMSVRQAAGVIMVCESDARHLYRVYPFLKQPVVVRNIPVYRSEAPADDHIREKYHIPEDALLGIYQGMVFEGRGLRTLVRATAETGRFFLMIVGEGPLLPELKQLSEQLGITKRVIFTGGVPFEQLYTYTMTADIGFTVITGRGLSYYHALPNKLFEYIQAGKPVIGSNYPEIKKVITGNRIGFCVPPESLQDITQAIHDMLKPENYEQFRKNTEKIRQKYTWQKESKKYLDVVRSLL
jgi:glycosyltransferase involved in cell wall biosynthesis